MAANSFLVSLALAHAQTAFAAPVWELSGPPPAPPVTFDDQLDDYAVLQSTSGGVAMVFGTTTSNSVTVTVSGPGCTHQTVVADLTLFAAAPSAWKAKVPGKAGGECTITARDENSNSATLQHVTYGDVWYCGGQVECVEGLAIIRLSI